MVYRILIEISACVLFFLICYKQISKILKSNIHRENALESDENNRLLLEQIKDYAIFLIDPMGKITAWNLGAEHLKGYTAEEIIGKNFAVFYTPDDIDRNVPCEYLKLAKENGCYETEGWRVRKDGAWFWAQIKLTCLFNSAGKLKGYAKVTKDITSNKKLCDQVGYLAGLAKHYTDAIVSVGLDGNIISWNRGVETFGFKQHESPRQKKQTIDLLVLENQLANVLVEVLEANTNYRSVVSENNNMTLPMENTITRTHPEDLQSIKTKISDTLHKPGIPIPFQGRFQHGEGYYFWLEGTFTNMLQVEGIWAVISNFRDVTERKSVEEELVKSENSYRSLNIELEKRVITRTQQLKEKNDEMESFSYSVSHDLRAPLRGIIGFTEILEEQYADKFDDEARRLTGVIKNNTVKMTNLINELLTFSRMGRHEIVKTSINMNEMVEQVIRDIQQKIAPNSINWTIQPLESVSGDIHSICQVWVNLISNAIKFSALQPFPKIEISSLRNQDQIVFRVSDNGVGFDSNYKDKLFKVFQRLHTSSEFEGTGIGLSIVEKIISRHGGKVWAESGVDKGANFYFSLPAK
jgi:PAS domain S-box-containing protein